MKASETRARRLMACLGDSSRFHLVRALSSGPRCVTELASEVGLSQSCTTRHLQALARHAIVARRRQGKKVLFTLEAGDPLIAELVGLAAGGGPATRSPGRARPAGGARVTGVQGDAAAMPEHEAAEDRDETEASPDESKDAPSPGPGRAPARPGDIEDYLL